MIIKHMSIMITIHFFFTINGLKGYFEERNRRKYMMKEI